jgi:hypothetical protein
MLATEVARGSAHAGRRKFARSNQIRRPLKRPLPEAIRYSITPSIGGR